MKKRLFCLMLSLLMILTMLQGVSSAETGTAGDLLFSDTRGVRHERICIDDDPTDGYEGDYVVIYNPSTSASNSQSTGKLTGLIETTVEPNIVPNPDMQTLPDADFPFWKIDIDSVLKEQAEATEPGPEPMAAKASYNVGSKKTFSILSQYSPTGSGSMEFECLYVGEHCYIWTPVSSANNTYPLDEIDETYAKMAADEFDSKFDLMQSSFGNHSNGSSGDGKLHMLYYNIDEGWNGSGGYIAGFFYQVDLSNNGVPILNIDTYPGVYYKNPNSGNVYKRMDDTYNTMVHEYQHLINYSNTSGMDTWLNECFSAAAEEICYPGSSVVNRIQSWEEYYYNGDWQNPPAEFEYQSSFQLHNGYSMYNWSNNISDVLALYAQVSFFAQYLYTRFGNTIYRQISDQYTSSEVNAITKATGVNCAELVRNFRIAVTANASQDQYGGIYGFKAQDGYDPSQYNDLQNPWDLLSPIIFTGSSCSIKGGGAITVKPVNGVYTPPTDAGSNLQYFGIKFVSPYTVTAISNNEAWGTVSVEDTKITCVPSEGCYVADYEVVSGTATATVQGNIIRVNPESDCTIRVIFAPKPSYTVDFVAGGIAQGQETALHGSTITLPSSVTVNPDDWTFIGWTETEIPGETESRPAYYAPGADYTVTDHVTLYAVYSRAEENVGAPVYTLISEAPSDWSGNYVITYRTADTSSSPMYLMKGVSVSSDGAAIEGPFNCDAYTVTGAVLNGTTLTDVSDTYVFTLQPRGDNYSIQNVATGTYLGEDASNYLAGYRTYSSDYCDWKPGSKTQASSATYAKGGSYPLIAFYVDGPYFWTGNSNNSTASYVRFWKGTPGDATYYTTNPEMIDPTPTPTST
ncbi:MAG: InlB B-repeat-containing protein, partial [Clostridia bacterium]|nr:InlB B-repeat-containing protein [Clostridia bacterium]